MIIVSDTSPLSHLAKVAQLSLLHQLYSTVIIPDAVTNELKKVDAEEQEIAELLAVKPILDDLLDDLIVRANFWISEQLTLFYQSGKFITAPKPRLPFPISMRAITN